MLLFSALYKIKKTNCALLNIYIIYTDDIERPCVNLCVSGAKLGKIQNSKGL